MKILVTGASGFVGRNLVESLNNIKNQKDNTQTIQVDKIYTYDIENSLNDLDCYTRDCDFIINLAGINRPHNPKEFYEGNRGFIESLAFLLKKNNNKCPILVSSSIQVGMENDYAKSKKEGEDFLLEFSKNNGNQIYIYRFANLFGKWCKPNYNSVVATWCYNIANDIDIQISNSNTVLSLCYIDDVINEIIACMNGKAHLNGDYYDVSTVYPVSLGDIAKLLKSFKSSRNNLLLANQSDDFSKKLYATYLSYLPTNNLNYLLKMNIDDRGSFTEFIKTKEYGQISINISKPGTIKGNHWHNTKNEKFLVVSGDAVIRFRKIGEKKVTEYKVSGEKLEVIDIPIGYTHNIENIGMNDMVTVMWVNEIFCPQKPDTYFEEV